MHIFQVIAGAQRIRFAVIMLKSLLYHYKGDNDIHFHWIVEPKARRTIDALMQSWKPRHVKYRFYWNVKRAVT